MPEDTGVQQRQLIAARQVVDALGLVTMMHGAVVERPEPVCSWPKLCGQQACRFPRYFRGGEPAGLVAYILLELGYPGDLLKALDTEYEIGEVLHPGVKIARSRNAALSRIEPSGIRLLGFVQDRQKLGQSWMRIAREAVRPKPWLPLLDARRRPWLY